MLALTSRTPVGNTVKPEQFVTGHAARLSWAWDGLCFAVPFGEATNEGFRDVVTNALPSTVSGAAWVRDSQGNSAANMNTSAYLEYADNPTHDRPSSAITAYVRFKKSVSSDDGGAMLCNNYLDGTAPWLTWMLGDTDPATGKLNVAILTTSGPTVPTELPDAAAMTTGEYVSAFLRWRTGEALRLDVLGEHGQPLSGLTGGTVLNGNLKYNAGKGIRVNSSDSVTSNFGGYYSQAMVWNRRLVDVELSSLVADPFGWYAPRRETVLMAGPFPILARGGTFAARSPDPADVTVTGPTAPFVGGSQIFDGG